ncbi:MAG TPA: glycosyltransferase [Phycisphaerales bacterium]|nr:glycosyltransferase [Phycisphaerales bacterium]
MISYVLPTRDRQAVLDRTLAALAALPPHAGELIVVDNASAVPARAPARLVNGIPARVVRLGTNQGAAGRNHGVAAADRASEWIVMLDDDSHPLGTGHLAAVGEADQSVGAVAAEIWLAGEGDVAGHATRRGHEAGGLPEVFIGCGVAVRRAAWDDVAGPWGGYDPQFGYYAEEYDLAARLLLGGWRVRLDRRFAVAHHKVAVGRDMGLILARLVRNNGWVMGRYAPAECRRREVGRVITRYARIARREGAMRGYGAGLAELVRTLGGQCRRPMPRALFDRFTGLAAARESLQGEYRRGIYRSAAIVGAGKNAHVIREALRELGVRLTSPDRAEVRVLGTMSPGPLLDAWAELAVAGEGAGRLLSPWSDLTGAARAGAAVRAAA